MDVYFAGGGVVSDSGLLELVLLKEARTREPYCGTDCRFFRDDLAVISHLYRLSDNRGVVDMVQEGESTDDLYPLSSGVLSDGQRITLLAAINRQIAHKLRRAEEAVEATSRDVDRLGTAILGYSALSRSALDLIPQPVIVSTTTGKIIGANVAFETTLSVCDQANLTEDAIFGPRGIHSRANKAVIEFKEERVFNTLILIGDRPLLKSFSVRKVPILVDGEVHAIITMYTEQVPVKHVS